MITISFFAPGIPVPKGSGTPFRNSRTNKLFVRQSNADRQRPWVDKIASAALASVNAAAPGFAPVRQAVHIERLTFCFPRPKAHYRTGKNAHLLREDAPTEHISMLDIDKLERCVLDALTAVLWIDDRQVSRVRDKEKVYADIPGVHVTVSLWT